jgi:PQQ-dependent dehydrogenase (methanol/ethanol family)
MSVKSVMCTPWQRALLTGLAAVATWISVTFNAQHAWATDAGDVQARSPWPTYNNGYKSQRYSPLTEITGQNVSALKEVCRFKIDEGGPFETGLVVVDGTMYLTSSLNTYALDPISCKAKWKYSYALDQAGVLLDPANRGVAVMNGRVFRGTPDGRLIALDAKTGQLIWKDVVGDPTSQESIKGVPLAWNGVVIAGMTGDEGHIKGRILAFDAATGRELWRFTTIPTGNEVGADTWESRTAAEHGGGGTWSTFTLDVTTGELFVPVGSPSDGLQPQSRPGANLFTCSFVVLDARTGALKWWYQLVPNDSHDLDLAATPMLYVNSEGRAMVAAAGKDGYVHVIDRLTHELLFKTPVTTVENTYARASEREARFCPSTFGGTEWNGPAFDQTTQTIFVGAVDWCVLIKSKGTLPNGFLNLEFRPATDPPPSGWLTAIDANTGKVKWKYHSPTPIIAGVTATAAGLVLTGDTAGNFLVFDSATGTLLYKKNGGAEMAGGVITYDIGGKQYISFTSGNGSRGFYGPAGPPSIVVMALDEATRRDAARRASGSQAAAVAHGRQVYSENCSSCHGARGEGGTGFPALKDVKDRRTYEDTVKWIKDPKAPMPKLYPSPLNEQAVRDVVTFIRTF